MLAGTAAGLAPLAGLAGATRVVSLDYGLAQTLLALGAVPAGLPDPADYRNWVIDPPLPPGVQDLGGRVQPNLDVLAELAPDAILAIADHDPILPLLQRIAPVLRLPVYTAERQPWALSAAAAQAIGACLGRPDAAARLVTSVTARVAAARAELARRPCRPVLLASAADNRHLRVYAAGSILQAGLDRLGLRNAWAGPTSLWGSATVPFEKLAGLADAAVFLIEPLPPGVLAALDRNPLWQALPFVRAGRVLTLPPVLMFGTLPSVDRLASLLLARRDRIAADV